MTQYDPDFVEVILDAPPGRRSHLGSDASQKKAVVQRKCTVQMTTLLINSSFMFKDFLAVIKHW